ncbi:MAG: glycosyltransferase family 87 protein [Thermoleophilia bacterium]
MSSAREHREAVLRASGAWLGFIVAAFGSGMTAVVLARGGGYYVVVPRLAYLLPLAVVGAIAGLAALGVARNALSVAGWLGLIVAAGFAWNFLVYAFKFGSGVWGVLLPLAHPTGIDFRDGLYDPAAAFSTLHSGWPPLTLLLGRPFTLVSFSTAYIVQVALLVALGLAAAALSGVLAAKAAFVRGLPGRGRAVGAKALALVMALWLVTSYGFMYEVERGNIDLYALVFSLLAVWLMIRFPRSAWLPAAVLAIAIGLKLYPAVLVVLLVWRYRWRALLPGAVSVLAVLLIAGPANLRDSFATLGAVQANRASLGWSNHSSAALAHILQNITGWAPEWVGYPLLLVPLAVWGFTLVTLVRRGWSDRNAIVAAAASVPLMGIVPSISHDYRLVLCVFPLAVLTAMVATMRREPGVVWPLLFGMLALTVILLARSSLVVAPSLQASKYALLVVVQALLLVVVLMTGREATPAG